MKKRLIILFTFVIFLSISSNLFPKESQIGSEELQKWAFYGQGFAVADMQNNQLVLAELPGSKGVMMVSPQSYPDNIVVSYKIRPLTPESVLVILLSASDGANNSALTFPDGYDGSIQHLLKETDNYFIAFHNAAHKKTPFIRKCVRESSTNTELVAAGANIMTTEWHRVETGKQDGKLWLKIDNEIIIETNDKQPVARGHVIFRMRGTTERIGVALIKDVKIEVAE